MISENFTLYAGCYIHFAYWHILYIMSVRSTLEILMLISEYFKS